MTTGGRLTLVEKLELQAKSGEYKFKTRAWLKDVYKLAKEGVEIRIFGAHREGEVSCEFNWLNCTVDLRTFSNSDPTLTRGNRLWVMAYAYHNPHVKINI